MENGKRFICKIDEKCEKKLIEVVLAKLLKNVKKEIWGLFAKFMKKCQRSYAWRFICKICDKFGKCENF